MHWVGLHRFSNLNRMFRNPGDGTYQTSGLLAIRQANLTRKILLSDAVAMTDGQKAGGEPGAHEIAAQVLAEG